MALTAIAGAGAIAAAPASADSVQPATGWQENLAQPHSDDVNTAWTGHALTVRDHGFRSAAGKSGGYALDTFPVHRLATPTDQVAVATADQTPAGTHVDVDVRGQRADGTWTEWTAAAANGPTRLPLIVTDVQTRLMLRGAASGLEPAVSAVTVTPAPATASGMRAATATTGAAATPLSFQVFATDENDVGGTTANGHTIQPNDHFVALPATTALSPLNSNQYSVQVCATKCETAPVWDVGPWDIHNNYWDPASQRTEFTDLAQGTPEAKAAYYDGYNGGKDDYYGQTILNPAGIDLADGTFADIGLTDNGLVTVTYLWTGGTSQLASPAVSITSPGAEALVGGNVTVTASASDATAGASLSTQFFVDGTAYGSAVAGSSPSITWNSSAVNGKHTLTAVTTAASGGQSASTTSAAVSVNVRNRFQVAFNASGGSNTLYLYGNGTGAINGATPVGVAPGTHPAIAELAGGGFQVAFAADKTNQLYLYGTGPGSVTGSTPVGVAAGTSPAITALPGGGFQTVFTASGGNTLWRYGVGAGSYTGSTPVGVAAGTSPAVTTLSNGSIQVAFTAANTNQLYLYGDGTGAVNGATPAGVAAGTSPAITALPGGGFQTVFTASGGSNTLWRYGVGTGSYSGSTPVGLAAGTSPAITTLSNGSIQVAFTAADTNQLYLYGDGTGAVNGATPVGVAAGTNPAITALPSGGFQTVFTASGGSNTLWRYGVGTGSYSGSTPVGVAAGTSPAIN